MEICARQIMTNTAKPVTNFTGLFSWGKKILLKPDTFERTRPEYPNKISEEEWEKVTPINYKKDLEYKYINHLGFGVESPYNESVGATPLKKNFLPTKTLDISNFQYPSGSIAITSDFNHAISTNGLLSCAGLAIVDKANKTQSLFHCNSQIDAKRNRVVLEKLLKGKNPKDLDITIVKGCYSSTEKTISFLMDNIKDILKEDCPVNFKYFPSNDINTVMVKDGQVLCSNDKLLKKDTNPADKIIFAS